MSGVFVSHASADDDFVAELRRRLTAQGVEVWVDSRRLRGGDALAPTIERAIVEAPHVIVVLSPATANSKWVSREVRKALATSPSTVIPLLLPGMKSGALHLWFPDEEPVAVEVGEGPLGLTRAMPQLLTALGVREPTDDAPLATPDAPPVAELGLHLSFPRIHADEGTRRAAATAKLVYTPAEGGREVESPWFAFVAPLGPIEADDLAWYLERYYRWPLGVFRDRAAGIEQALPGWGEQLFAAAFGDEKVRNVVAAWQGAAPTAGRRFSVLVNNEPAPGVESAEAAEAATELLGLPWELLHDGRTWLFQGGHAVRVRRRLPNYESQPVRETTPPIRILLLSPRPTGTGYIDHRASALPLVQAVESLGELVRLTVLDTPTYAALSQALDRGDDGHPFDVVHFDGHGVYDRRNGLGALCFEQSTAAGTLDLVDADRLAGLVRAHRVPLVFLEACQTATAKVDPTSSVAARLLSEGVTSVVAMSHSVLVETARRFVAQFYADLAAGARVGAAMLAGQRELYADAYRGRIPGAGSLELQDWFVPVLYQEKDDPQLVQIVPSSTLHRLAEQSRNLSLGMLPEPPEHSFQGRSRDLLALERHLHANPWVVIRGTGGQGKTTLAVELVRWLVRTRRAERAVFVPIEHYRDPAAVLDTVGRQLVGSQYSVAAHLSLDAAVLPVERALRDQPTIVLVDNCESLFPDAAPVELEEEDSAAAIFALCRRLLAADPRTRVVFTSREALPAPFADPAAHRELGPLHRDDAIELVTQVLTRNRAAPPANDTGTTPDEVTALVEAVGCHARALVLLARETARIGVTATTRDLNQVMARLEQRHPGDRENSLYASVALSLRRLPSPLRTHVDALAACHSGIHIAVLAELTGLDIDGAREVAVAVIEVGLGEDLGDGCLGLDPGLAPYLRGELDPTVFDQLQTRWATATTTLTTTLYQQLSRDVGWAARVTRRLMPDLLATLDWTATHQPPDQVIALATRIETLVQELGQPRALAHAARTRTTAAAQLGDWSHARYLVAAAEIDRLLDQGQLPAALDTAQHLLTQAQAGGEDAFPEAAYDLALTHFYLGRVLRSGGAAEAALLPLAEARRHFQHLADTGNQTADRMAGVTLGEIGHCLLELGRWEQAADAYQDALDAATHRGDDRDAAANNAQLARVRLEQGRYEEALAGYTAALEVFQQLGEPGSVAVAWHQIGRVHQAQGRFEAAEQAYQHALALHVQQNNQAAQAATLDQLGLLYAGRGRWEEAAGFHQQAIDIDVRSGDHAREGRHRNNLANTLLQLGRHDQARTELHRALDRTKPYGHAAQPWKTWALVEDLEHAAGHPDAARTAREQAITTYLAYRHAGGASQHPAAPWFDGVAQAIAQNATDQAARELAALAEPEIPPRITAFITILQALLAGDPEPARTDHPDLDIFDVVELRLLLEALGVAEE